jgi:CRP/FNR family transcriptional regulator
MNSAKTIQIEDLIDLLTKNGRKKIFQANQEIFREGENADFLPFVLNGKVKMVRFPDVGKEVIISVFGKGEIFAVPPVFDGEPYPATVISMEETELLLIHREDFLRLLRESHEFSFAIIGWMCEMLREKTSVIKNLATASPEHRIGNVLLRLAEKQHSDGTKPIKISLRRQDIAEMAGLTTETTIRAARRLAEKNLITITRGKITLEATEDLQNFLDS